MDPQEIGKKWIQAMEKNNNLQIQAGCWAPNSGEKSEFGVNAQNGPKISRKSEQMLAQAPLKGFPSVQAAATPWIVLETSLLPNPKM